MRQTISGLVAAIAVVTASAAPALACGGGLFTSCAPCGQAYVSPCSQGYGSGYDHSAYYGAAAYGPPPWSPAWYSYCRHIHGAYFNPNTGYFQGADGGWYFCQ